MMTTFKKAILVLYLLASSLALRAQPHPLTIEACYAFARENYPLVKQRVLISLSRDYAVEKASKGYLPQVTISGQASYQSAVTQIPLRLPGAEIPILSKDQYRIYGEVSQSVFDGGVIRQQKRIEEAGAVVEAQKLEVELYKLNDRINQLFFGTLIIDEQIIQNNLLEKDIESGLKKTEAAIVNGAALKSSADLLKAELLKAHQRSVELKAGRKAYLDMLGLFINQTLPENTLLSRPQPLLKQEHIRRPELLLYDYQHQSLDVQTKMLSARNLPRLNLFVQSGFGRPALNMLSNRFDPYYIAGIRFSWSLSGFYTLQKERALIDVSRKNMELQKETFLFHTALTLRQQDAEISKYQELLRTDDEIISLRSDIKNNHLALLENGVINTSDYLREVNAEDQARQNKLLHEIQWLMMQYSQQITKGF